MRRRAHSIGGMAAAANDEAKAEVLAITGELARIAERTITEALAVADNAKRSLGPLARRPQGTALASSQTSSDHEGLLEQIVAQARSRIAGDPERATRIVSLHDPTPARSKRAGSESPSSSATRPDQSTTPTASCRPRGPQGNPNEPRCSSRRSLG